METERSRKGREVLEVVQVNLRLGVKGVSKVDELFKILMGAQDSAKIVIDVEEEEKAEGVKEKLLRVRRNSIKRMRVSVEGDWVKILDPTNSQHPYNIVGIPTLHQASGSKRVTETGLGHWLFLFFIFFSFKSGEWQQQHQDELDMAPPQPRVSHRARSSSLAGGLIQEWRCWPSVTVFFDEGFQPVFQRPSVAVLSRNGSLLPAVFSGPSDETIDNLLSSKAVLLATYHSSDFHVIRNPSDPLLFKSKFLTRTTDSMGPNSDPCRTLPASCLEQREREPGCQRE
eukprot:g45594.t1